MTAKTVRVSVIILNYNGREYLRNLFVSLSNQSYTDFKIILVDNSSSDDSLLLLSKILSTPPCNRLNVELVLNKENLGYCRGNNVGLEQAEGEYVVFLNNDTYVSSSWLLELVKVMDRCQSIGACQSRIISAVTNRIQTDGWLLDQFGSTAALVLPNHFIDDCSTLPFYASGTSLIVRCNVLKTIKGFDPMLFSGDFDFCWQIRLLGYDIATVPKSACYHYGQVATRELYNSRELTLCSDKEFTRVFLKNHSGPVFFQLCRLITRMVVVSLFNSYKQKDPRYALFPSAAILWNLKVLRNTLLLRGEIMQRKKNLNNPVKAELFKGSIEITRRLRSKGVFNC